MDTVDGFSCHVEQHDTGPVVWLKGELDIATAPQLEDCLRELGEQTVTIDFSELAFIDSSGIGVLVRRSKARGPDSIVLRGVQPAQMRIFKVTGLTELFNLDSA